MINAPSLLGARVLGPTGEQTPSHWEREARRAVSRHAGPVIEKRIREVSEREIASYH